MSQVNNVIVRGEANLDVNAKVTANGDRTNTAYINNSGTNEYGNANNDSVVNGSRVKISPSKALILNNKSYGTSLPATGENGQVFFKIV